MNVSVGPSHGRRGPSPPARRFLVLAAVASVAAWLAVEILAPREVVEWTPQMHAAAERMAAALELVRAHRLSEGPPLERRTDPNATGVIGPEDGALFTTLGQVEAKRTTTIPDVAALMVHLLQRGGVGAGDRVAIGASASFPALLVATLTAAEALGARPLAVLSLGASSHGLTDPAFDLLHLHQLLVEEGVVGTPPAAVSLGGARDVGEDFDPEVRARLLERIRESGIPLVLETEPRRSVARRMELWGGVTAFVNIGGASANVGTNPTLLSFPPGLLDPEGVPLPPPLQRGVLHGMAEAGVPIVHLLDVRTLASRHGLPWDPSPLPRPGTTHLLSGDDGRSGALWGVAGAWLAAMALLATLAFRFSRQPIAGNS